MQSRVPCFGATPAAAVAAALVLVAAAAAASSAGKPLCETSSAAGAPTSTESRTPPNQYVAFASECVLSKRRAPTKSATAS
eukprot:3317190-Alexandrium_andersonii.AAC.1